ncbi:MAG: STAS domain-containing protein [Pontibacterium sp.]
MQFSMTSYDKAKVVHMPEQLTITNAAAVKKDLVDLIDSGNTRLVLDLAGLNFSDSSGLAVLVAVFKAIEAKSGKTVLLSPQTNVRALLELTRLHEIFEIFNNPQSAVERVSA